MSAPKSLTARAWAWFVRACVRPCVQPFIGEELGDQRSEPNGR